jgi:hypothetical protein
VVVNPCSGGVNILDTKVLGFLLFIVFMYELRDASNHSDWHTVADVMQFFILLLLHEFYSFFASNFELNGSALDRLFVITLRP